ncbi:hypothetical protein GLOTRDRAFT_133800 [Gloeophyllum trabeum ATCC 11539]|uniref:Uncharacterized protein n=1 Tax=Gloeophyllum trabeum (strain ATCC 11539 / FP-39264 / Madison 617) TaxID=670483 RepID=S7PTE7_GLOTA|nr:uncharacterized protein GLOTRDRAFT_133800 [Gloeophyllum trabeum ATCC 11539]EPQ50698.1 hypothetical protein GLOTRDRAFT_133800 [Gloeophyllum trabeum ATCC 11539]
MAINTASDATLLSLHVEVTRAATEVGVTAPRHDDDGEKLVTATSVTQGNSISRNPIALMSRKDATACQTTMHAAVASPRHTDSNEHGHVSRDADDNKIDTVKPGSKDEPPVEARKPLLSATNTVMRDMSSHTARPQPRRARETWKTRKIDNVEAIGTKGPLLARRTTGVDSLPLEILCEIFSLAIADASARWASSRKCYEEAELLMKVCERWKDIILGNGTFWSNIVVSGVTPDFVAEIIRRSGKSTPLSIRGNLVSDRDADAKKIEYILRESNRIRLLDLEISTGNLRKLGAGEGMPKLEELRLTRIVGTDEGGDDESIDLGGLQSTRLHKLSLCNVSFKSYEPLLSDATTDLILDNPMVVLSTDDLLGTLDTVPNLRSLEILSSIDARPVSPHDVISLTRLERISVDPIEVEDVRFLGYIRTPQLKQADLSILSKDDETVLPGIMELIAPIVSQAERENGFHACRFRARDEFSLELEFGRNLEAFEECASRPIVHLDFDNLHLQENFLPTITEALGESLSAVHDLQIVDGECATATREDWAALFEHMPEVRTLRLHDRSARVVPLDFMGAENVPALFPKLESAIVRGGTRKQLLRLFKHCDNAHINNLTISDVADVTRGDIDSLAHIAHNISWDGMDIKVQTGGERLPAIDGQTEREKEESA